MRATDFLSEIERLDKDDYTGGKGELAYVKKPGKKKVMPLPGGSGLQYAIMPETAQFTTIAIINPNHTEPKPVMGRWEWRDEFEQRLAKWEQMKAKGTLKPKPQVIGKLSLYGGNQGIPGAVKVSSITVDEDYRGQGIAKALYGIVLTIMKKTLIAGGEQTPGGRKNWLSLASIPGVEIKGFVQIYSDDVNFDPSLWPNHPGYNAEKKRQEKIVDSNHDKIMRMGGQFITKDRYSEYWAFDVLPGNGELAPAVKTSLNTLYDKGEAATGLYARWVG